MFQKAKTKFGKLIMLLLVVVCTVCLAIGLVGCSGDARSISSVAINDAGHLIITWSDSEEQDLGLVVGANGEDGAPGAPGDDGATGATGNGIAKVEIDENGNLVVYYTADETTGVTVGPVKGDKGDTGAAGVGIKDITIDENGELVITLTDDTVLRPGTVVGDKGETGATGVGITGIDYNTETGDLTITLSNEQTYTFNIKGQDGANGVGIANIDLKQVQEGDSFTEEGLDVVGTYYWEITYTDSTEEAPHIDRVALPMLTEDVCSVDHASSEVNEEGVGMQQVIIEHSADSATGVAIYICSECGYSRVNYADESVHTFTERVVDPTCEDAGYTIRSCECGYRDGEPIYDMDGDGENDYPANGHTLPEDQWYPVDVSGANICEEGGLYACRCTVCGAVVRDELPPQDHVLLNPTVQIRETDDPAIRAVYLVGTCENCGEEQEEFVMNIERPDLNGNTAESDISLMAAAPAGAVQVPVDGIDIYVAIEVVVTKYQEKCTDDGEYAINVYVGPDADNVVLGATETIAVEGQTNHTMAVIDGEAIQIAVGAVVDLDVYGEYIEEAIDAKATCLQNGEGIYHCTVCEEAVRVITTRDHNYSGDYKPVEGHEATCTTAGLKAHTCTMCGATDPVEANWEPDAAFGHTYVADMDTALSITVTNYETGAATIAFPLICETCNDKINAPVSDLTVSTTVVTEATCAVDGSYSYTVTYKPTNESRTLTVNVAKSEVPHFTFGAWVTVDGQQYLNLSDPITLAQLEAYQEQYDFFAWNETDVANCATADGDTGTATYFCPICNSVDPHTVTVNTIRYHQFGEDRVIVAPDCMTNGSITGHCEYCDEDITNVTLPALGHHYEYELILSEGTGADGADVLTLYRVGCTECDAEIYEEVISFTYGQEVAEGYTLTYDDDTEPTSCDKPGLGTYTLTFTDVYYTYTDGNTQTTKNEEPVTVTDTKVIATIPHRIPLAAGGSEELRSNRTYCVYGPDSETDIYVFAELYDEPATCLEEDQGRGYFYCAECGGLVFVYTTGSHQYGEYVILEGDEPTCTAPGTETATCIFCHEATQTRPVAALGHGDYTTELITPPTASSTGTLRITCGREGCGHYVDVTISALPTQNMTTATEQYVVTPNGVACISGTTFTYQYTLTWSDGEEGDNNDTVVYTNNTWTMTTEPSDHTLNMAITYRWEELREDGYYWQYEGHLCTVCNRIIAERTQLNKVFVEDTEGLLALAVKDGMTIILGEGTFNVGTLSWAAADLTIEGAGADKTIIVGSFNFGKGSGNFDNTSFTVKNLTITAPATDAAQQGIFFRQGGSNNVTLTIEDCIISDWQYGVQIGSGFTDSKLVLSGTVSFVDNWCAISMGTAGSDGTSRNNTVQIDESVVVNITVNVDVTTYALQEYYPNLYYATLDKTTALDGAAVEANRPTAADWYATVNAEEAAA